MDSKNIIEEIDIIIRAKVEEARKDIRSVVKETEKMVSSVSGNMKKLDKSGQLDSFRKGLENARDELENLEEEVREIGVTMDGVKFKFNPKIEGDFTKQYEKAIEEAEKEMEKESSFSIKPDIDMEKVEKRKAELRAIAKEFNNPGSGGSSAPSPSSSSKGGKEVVEHHHPDSGLSKEYDVLREKIKASVQELKNLKAEASKLELKGMNPYEIMSFSDGFKLLRAQITETFPTLSQFKADVQANLSGALGDVTLLQKMALGFENLKTKISSVGVAIKTKVNDIKTSFSNIGGAVSGKLAPLTNLFGNIGKFGVATFNKVKTKLQSMGDTVSSPVNKLKTFINRIRSLGNEADKAKKKGSSLGSAFTKGFNGVGKAISSGVGSIKKFALSLLSVRGAFTMISRAAQSYLSFDTQLQDSITNSWNVLGSLLAPILEYVAGLFSRLVSVVATFVKTLTGVDLVAKANAKALDKQTKSAQKTAQAQKQLSGIDDIDTLSSGSGGGEDTPTIKTEAVDLGPLESYFDKAQKLFSKIFEPFKKAWEKDGKSVMKSFSNMINSIGTTAETVFGSVFDVWTNGTGTEIVSNFLGIFQQLFDLVNELSVALNLAWSEENLGTSVVQSLADSFVAIQTAIQTVNTSLIELASNGSFQTTFSLILQIFNNLFTIIGSVTTALSNAWATGDSGTKIFQGISDIFNNILKFTKDVTGALKTWVMSPEFQSALDKVFDVVSDIFEVAGDIADWILEMYETYVQPVVEEKLLPALTEIMNAIGDIWAVAKPIIDKIIKIVKDQLEPVIKGVSGAVGGIIDVVKGVAQFISGVFTGDWKKAWEGIKNIFSGILDTLGSIVKIPLNMVITGFEGLVNALISAFNSFKKTLNKLSFDIPDWIPVIGGGKWGFNFKMADPIELPRLASGTVAREPMVAQIAEYAGARNNPEIVSPVNMMKSVFRDVLNEFDTSGTRFDKLVINVAGENFYDDTIDYINDKSERMGVSVIKEM